MDYIKLSRKIIEWEWYSDINTCRMFIHMLLKANWRPGRFQGVEINRGEFVSSYNTLACESGLSVRSVRTALTHLISTGEVTVKRHPKFSVFTVNNYSRYQDTDTQIDNQPTQERHRSDTGATTIEEGKKERREEYNNSITDVMLSPLPQPETEESHIFATIQELYNTVCGSYPRLVKMSDKRKKAIKARLKTGYTLEDFKTLFEKAESSDFLKGKNKRNWRADFDWLTCDSNMAKTLEGKYDNKTGGGPDDPGGKTHGAEKGYIQQLVEAGVHVDFDGFG